MSTGGKRAAHDVDVWVGARIRVRRKLLGISQAQLADAIGLTFQQVQKYERGSNRVSSSKLYEIAGKLEVPIAYFFHGLPDAAVGVDEDVGASNRKLAEYLATPGALELLRAYSQVRQPSVRRRFIALLATASETLAANTDIEADEEAPSDEDGVPAPPHRRAGRQAG